MYIARANCRNRPVVFSFHFISRLIEMHFICRFPHPFFFHFGDPEPMDLLRSNRRRSECVSCCCFALVCRFVLSIKREENNCYNYVNKIFSSWNVRFTSVEWMDTQWQRCEATSACRHCTSECLHTIFRLQLPLPVCLVNMYKKFWSVVRGANTRTFVRYYTSVYMQRMANKLQLDL